MQGVLDDVMWYGPLLGWTYQMKEPFSIKIDGDTSYPMPKAAMEEFARIKDEVSLVSSDKFYNFCEDLM